MKKLLAVSLSINAALIAGLLWKEVSVHAQGGGGVPVGNGDVNGDGSIDISDAVYLLSSLFLGGEAPVPIECLPPAGKGLPATGQTKCFGVGSNEIACDSADFPGQDGFYQAGCPSEGRFMDNGDETVTDTCTGLMWQKDTAPATYTWQGALNYCEGLDLAGHSDWRLPNVRELQSIVDYGRWNLAIDPVFQAVSGTYWSSSPSFPYNAWFVYSFDGSVGSDAGQGYHLFVRAVRNAP